MLCSAILQVLLLAFWIIEKLLQMIQLQYEGDQGINLRIRDADVDMTGTS